MARQRVSVGHGHREHRSRKGRNPRYHTVKRNRLLKQFKLEKLKNETDKYLYNSNYQ